MLDKFCFIDVKEQLSPCLLQDLTFKTHCILPQYLFVFSPVALKPSHHFFPICVQRRIFTQANVLNMKQESKIWNLYLLEVVHKYHTTVPVVNVTLLCAFFWVILRRLNFICQRFGTLCAFHLHTYPPMKMEQTRVLGNVGIWNSDAGELPRRKHIIFRTWGKFEIKNVTLPINDPSFRTIWVGNVEILFISVFNQLDAQNLFHNKFYFMPVHVSSTCARNM